MKFKTLKIACLTVVGSLALAAGASAAPTATTSVDITGQGNLYKEAKKPVNVTFGATITADGPTLNPLMNAKFNVPKDLAFVPKSGMPTCSFTEASADVPPDTAKASCPKAIIGDGKASLYIAQAVPNLVTDPIITIFNGKPDNGKGVLVIQAFSQATNHGILMQGEIQNGVLDVAIPRLTYDSSVPNFELNIPGTIGQDKNYAQATCSSGSYTSNAVLTLGKRDAGGVVTDQSEITTAETSVPCTASAGKASFSGLKIKGPKSVKSGKKGAFKVTVTNKGTASSKKGKITASGAGKGSVSLPALKPGVSKTLTVKAKVKGKKGKKVAVKFKAAGGASATGKVKVKIK